MTNTEPNQKEHSGSILEEILEVGHRPEVRALFSFDRDTSEEEVLLKFNIWGRHFFPKFYKVSDAPFHRDIDLGNIRVYRGEQGEFLDIAFRGAAKTTRTKLFVAFAIANDEDHLRRYFKVLSADVHNSVQIVTDVYNLLMNALMVHYYPEVFQKTVEKRQEKQSVFTTATGIKMQADSVGTDQRGDIQDESRPDFIWFDDFETRKTLRSAVITNAIWENMDEATQGLSTDGGCMYNCNYLSERGNVHKLVEKFKDNMLITPIKGKVVNNVHIDGAPTWPSAYTPSSVELKLKKAADPAGDYLCVPSAGADIMFDRKKIDKQEVKTPVKEIAGFKIFHEFDPSHRYGAGVDVAGGVGLDSSATVFIDFSTLPSRVVGTFHNNTIKPTTLGDEIEREANIFGRPIVAVENNKFDSAIERLRTLKYDNLYFQEMKPTRVGIPPKVRTLGWNTNSDTKPKMLFALKKAVEDGHLELSDADLIAELRSYTRDDLMDKDDDVRLTTRHFDLLIACAIAYWMKDFAEVPRDSEGSNYQQPDWEAPTNE